MSLQLYRAWFFTMVSALCLLTGNYAVGQEASESVLDSVQVSFQVGDMAPQPVVDQWLGGDAVQSYAKGNVYVVEFWATWCGPCIKAMPHLSELAERYAKDGLVVIAITKADEANSREAIEKFANGPGKKYRFSYAICEGDTTQKDYMEAAGQNGIPCSFVIDREGKLAYVGHPHDLDYVLERVIAGTWRGKADADELREMNETIAKLPSMAQSDPDKALKMVENIRRVNPARAKGLDFAYVEVMVLCKKKMFDKAKTIIEASTNTKGEVEDRGMVAMLSGLLVSKELNPEGVHRDFALGKIEEAEIALKDDWQNLVQVGVAYMMSGEVDKYTKCMNRVIELCPDEQLKKSLQMAVEMQIKAASAK